MYNVSFVHLLLDFVNVVVINWSAIDHTRIFEARVPRVCMFKQISLCEVCFGDWSCPPVLTIFCGLIFLYLQSFVEKASNEIFFLLTFVWMNNNIKFDTYLVIVVTDNDVNDDTV